ncbi:MAG: HAD-IC family P-type ATPase, partial [Proteobacteria bacterium]|nr:HAD-IC family P-type ATPase [Pseudomonadota bacterium]
MTLNLAVTDQPKRRDWYSKTTDDVMLEVDTTLGGLRNSEAAERLKANGRNELRGAKRINPFVTLASQFKSFLIWILLAAGIASWFLGERIDAVAILSIVLLNATIGFYQEFSAEKSIAALKKITAPKAKVRRDGKVVSLNASQVVVGDILELEAGDLVAADARLIETASLKSIESTLTGESKAVSKHRETISRTDLPLADRANMVFMGASITAGTGKAVVLATGMQSELGVIASLIANEAADTKAPLQKKLDSFGHFLVWTTLAIVALLFGLGQMRGKDPLELFMSSISLAVAAVPEGLPAIVTVALALGVSRLARRGALVRKLPAVETLGSTTVICTDKTGTLTIGDMTVRTLYVANKEYDVTGEGYGPEGEVRVDGKSTSVQLNSALSMLTSIHLCCNNSHLALNGGIWQTVGDPTEGALLALGAKAGADQKSLTSEFPKRYEFPFDSNRKRSSVVREIAGG